MNEHQIIILGELLIILLLSFIGSDIHKIKTSQNNGSGKK